MQDKFWPLWKSRLRKMRRGEMDQATQDFYQDNAESVSATYWICAGGVSDYFSQVFKPGDSVLDIGCGSGRDLLRLSQMGCGVFGCDSSEAMLAQCAKNIPDLEESLSLSSLPNLAEYDDDQFDGLLCSAVLMHLPSEQVFDACFNLRRILKENGSLLISIPDEDPTITDQRDFKGRLFNQLNPEKLKLLLERLGFQNLNHWTNADSLNRDHRKWHILSFRIQSMDGSRGLDKIESVLNKDKKVATYKLALFRALADIAQSQHKSVLWHFDKRVSLPIQSISEKWLEYYWPICESETFIPQTQGENPDYAKPIAFRALLNQLIAHYRNSGGLNAFLISKKSGQLSKEVNSVYNKLISKLNNTIKAGPVTYSGGINSGQTVFSYRDKQVYMPVEVWRELTIMGPWIQDATILRWAELTAKLSNQQLRPSQVIDLLLVNCDPDRDVHAVRSLYKKTDVKECVWSGKNLKDKFAVDHAIPYALWKNNDLWNLLPSDETVNNHKRDKLPSHQLLVARKDCIINYWEQTQHNYPERFAYEMKRVSGEAYCPNWQNKLFSFFHESVEITAIQRGVERWQPAVKQSTGQKASPKNTGFGIIDSQEIKPEQEFVDYLPYYDLKATAGGLNLFQQYDSVHQWIKCEIPRMNQDMFVLRVVGKSMEPKIPDNSLCVFRKGAALAGSRQNRIMLFYLHDDTDPNDGGRLTVKKYRSQKSQTEEGWQHGSISLQALNPGYQNIEITEGAQISVIGEFVRVYEK